MTRKYARIFVRNLVPRLSLLCLPLSLEESFSQRQREAEEREPGNEVDLSADIICSEKRTVFRERSSRKTVSFEARAVLKIGEYIYYPTALRRVQITSKTSTTITRYLNSREPVRQLFSQRAKRRNWIEVTKKNGGQFKLFF